MFSNIPWSILWQPRATMQDIVAAKTKPSIFLPCILGIFSQAALVLSYFGGQLSLSPWITIITLFTVAIFFFAVHLQLATIYFDMSANAMGGKGKSNNVFSAYCWSYMTEIFFLPFLLISLYGIITNGDASAFLNPMFMATLAVALYLWRLAIVAVALSEVKAISLFKAMIPVVIALIVVSALLIWAPNAFIA